MTYEEKIEAMAKAMWQEDNIRCMGKPRLVEWAEAGDEAHATFPARARAAAEAIGLREMMEALEAPMTKEQAMRTHPSQLEMRWALYSDYGPKDYEGYTFLDYQNYGNQFDSRICGLLWVRRKKPARALSPAP